MPVSGPLSRPHGIENEGAPLGQKPKLNFVGGGVTVANAGNKTVVTIPGGGPGGGPFDLQDGADLTGTPADGKGWVKSGASMVWTDLATQAELNAAAATAAADLAAHVADVTAVHAAASVAFTPDGSIAATNVQTAIQEVRDEAGAGTSVNDQTISTTDNTVNNATTSKHGWAPKLSGLRSNYLTGTGEWRGVYNGSEWFVHEGATAGGDGHSPGGAFTTFAAANAAANEGDIIYICSDLHTNCTLSQARVHVRGVGRVVIFGNGSAAANNITFNVTSTEVTLENLTFQGSSLFKGIHLCMNRRSNYFRLKDISIFGGGFATFYPTSPGAGTGVGGIGILCHGAEAGHAEDIYLQDCSIGVGLGTWSTQNTWNNVRGSQNCQDLVCGLYTGPNAGQAVTSSSFGYGVAAQGSNDQCGFNTFRGWRCVSNVVLAGFPPSIDLIGDGTYNYAGSSGGQHVFENCILSETGAAGPLYFRVGSANNVFIGCQISKPMVFNVAGQRNRFINLAMTNSLALNSDYNVVEGAYQMPNFNPVIYGIGSYNTIRNSQIWNPSGDPIVVGGIGWKYVGCVFDGSAAVTRANLGLLCQVEGLGGVSFPTYGTTVQLYPAGAKDHCIVVTNGTPFNIPNPLDHFNQSDTTKILTTGPFTIDVFNNTAGTMGDITWGSKFALQGGTFMKPAAGKHVLIDFYYNHTVDKWIEKNRTGDV